MSVPNAPQNTPSRQPVEQSVERFEKTAVEQLNSNVCLNVGESDSKPINTLDLQQQIECNKAAMSKSVIRKKVAAPILQRVVEEVAKKRALDWRELFCASRDTPRHASARVLAMAVACSAGVPKYMVAGVFGRTWQTVDGAAATQIAACRADSRLCDEFIAILTRALGPDT